MLEGASEGKTLKYFHVFFFKGPVGSWRIGVTFKGTGGGNILKMHPCLFQGPIGISAYRGHVPRHRGGGGKILKMFPCLFQGSISISAYGGHVPRHRGGGKTLKMFPCLFQGSTGVLEYRGHVPRYTGG